MSTAKTLTEIAEDNTSAVTVRVPTTARDFSVTVVAVDSNGDFEEVAAGSADLQIKVAGTTQYETVYLSDGTTAVSYDVTGAQVTRVIDGKVAASEFKSTPTGLTADKRLKMIVNYSGGSDFI